MSEVRHKQKLDLNVEGDGNIVVHNKVINNLSLYYVNYYFCRYGGKNWKSWGDYCRGMERWLLRQQQVWEV